MKRSTFIAGLTGGVMAAQSPTAATGILTNDNMTISKPRVDPATAKREYEICKMRGHVPTIEGNMHGMHSVNAVFIAVSDKADRAYLDHSETSWQECFHCGTHYRFVTNIEEQNKPK